jgi:phosphoribosylformylglycinamidine (FGAM) synthase-like enzyme
MMETTVPAVQAGNPFAGRKLEQAMLADPALDVLLPEDQHLKA